MQLLKIGNAIYNVDRLVGADFTPAAHGIDEETQEPFSHTATLVLRFAVTISDARTSYDGDYMAEEAQPYSVKLRGVEAEDTWAALELMAQQVYAR